MKAEKPGNWHDIAFRLSGMVWLEIPDLLTRLISGGVNRLRTISIDGEWFRLC